MAERAHAGKATLAELLQHFAFTHRSLRLGFGRAGFEKKNKFG
jgi:hypothetical protein